MMRRPAEWTIFTTPVISTALRWISRLVLRLRGWKTRVRLPESGRFVAVFAPHTSYWDLPVMLMVAFAHRVSAHWMGTHRLFRRPFGWLFRWLGGIPVDRTQSVGLVASAVKAFDGRKRFVLGIAPEGTRFPVPRWRTGFYYTAVGAGVPIVLAYLDSATRTAGADEWFVPTGDLAADAPQIVACYTGKVGIRPDRTVPPLLEPRRNGS
jgi:1-acyl-sn-glycerol-3-phosphate acyltransferase